jgi:hypothetical protein
MRESLVGIGRLPMFFDQPGAADTKAAKDLRTRLRTMSRAVRSLTEHASFLSAKINFLLDATLGMINIEQNARCHSARPRAAPAGAARFGGGRPLPVPISSTHPQGDVHERQGMYLLLSRWQCYPTSGPAGSALILVDQV